MSIAREVFVRERHFCSTDGWVSVVRARALKAGEDERRSHVATFAIRYLVQKFPE